MRNRDKQRLRAGFATACEEAIRKFDVRPLLDSEDEDLHVDCTLTMHDDGGLQIDFRHHSNITLRPGERPDDPIFVRLAGPKTPEPDEHTANFLDPYDEELEDMFPVGRERPQA